MTDEMQKAIVCRLAHFANESIDEESRNLASQILISERRRILDNPQLRFFTTAELFTVAYAEFFAKDEEDKS